MKYPREGSDRSPEMRAAAALERIAETVTALRGDRDSLLDQREEWQKERARADAMLEVAKLTVAKLTDAVVRLTRERDEAIKVRRLADAELACAMSALSTMTAQRDEALRFCENNEKLQTELNEARRERDQAETLWHKASRERDEIRRERDKAQFDLIQTQDHEQVLTDWINTIRGSHSPLRWSPEPPKVAGWCGLKQATREWFQYVTPDEIKRPHWSEDTLFCPIVIAPFQAPRAGGDK